jgi:type VI secretion system protein ImpF
MATPAGPRKGDRLAPPLMYAFRAAHAAGDAKKRLDLRDEAGERVIAGRRASVRTAITEPVLRSEVARDLSQLMNTTNLAAAEDLSDTPAVRRSILNFGIPDVVHRSIDETGVASIAAEIERALTDYEPRLIAQTIRASRDTRVKAADLQIRFLVRADMKCDPLNVPVEFIADIEVETGKIKIDRL